MIPWRSILSWDTTEILDSKEDISFDEFIEIVQPWDVWQVRDYQTQYNDYNFLCVGPAATYVLFRDSTWAKFNAFWWDGHETPSERLRSVDWLYDFVVFDSFPAFVNRHDTFSFVRSNWNHDTEWIAAFEEKHVVLPQ